MGLTVTTALFFLVTEEQLRMKRITTGGHHVSLPRLDQGPRMRRTTGLLFFALLCIAAVTEPVLAHAAYDGKGDGFNGDGLESFLAESVGAFDAGRVMRSATAAGHRHQVSRNDGDRWWHFYPYLRSEDGRFYGQSYSPQRWKYCSHPVGYYPYVAKCRVPWHPVDPDSLPVEPVPTG
jgi:hypothetical protein